LAVADKGAYSIELPFSPQFNNKPA